jgi:hypothetical protein
MYLALLSDCNQKVISMKVALMNNTIPLIKGGGNALPLKPSIKGLRNGNLADSLLSKASWKSLELTAGTRNKLEEGDKYFLEYLNYPNDTYLKKARQAYFEVEDNGFMSNWAKLYAKGMKAIASAIHEPGNRGSQDEASTVLSNLGRKGLNT